VSEQPPFAGAAAIAGATSLHETLNAANPSMERESALCATCQVAIAQSNWSTLVNWSKLAVNSGQNCKNIRGAELEIGQELSC